MTIWKQKDKEERSKREVGRDNSREKTVIATVRAKGEAEESFSEQRERERGRLPTASLAIRLSWDVASVDPLESLKLALFDGERWMG